MCRILNFLFRKKVMRKDKFWRCKDFNILLQRNKITTLFKALMAK